MTGPGGRRGESIYPTSSTKTHTSDFCSCLFPSGQDLVLQFSTAVGVGERVGILTPWTFVILAGRGHAAVAFGGFKEDGGGAEERGLVLL